jgi:rhodanese-related sulfurtransferase
MRIVAAVMVEAILVAAAGSLLALAANAVSPRGLRLGRDYFPSGGKTPAVIAAGVPSPAAPAALIPAAGAALDLSAAVARRLQQHGLRAATAGEVVAWYRDPHYEQGLTVFIDARNDAQFQAGHIPGAWQFDHYRAEQHLAAVLPVCLTALKVVVYCTGGQCEDSEFAAVMLRDVGVPRENLLVYPGGLTEWKANHQPVEVGARRSGRFLPAKP